MEKEDFQRQKDDIIELDTKVNEAKLDRELVDKAFDIYRKESIPFRFGSPDLYNSRESRFPKTLVSCDSAYKSIYSLLFIDLFEEKLVLALVHDTKEFYEGKLAEISEFAKTAVSPNGILLNWKYLGDNERRYDPASLLDDKIVFCKQYAYDSLMKESFLGEFTHDCKEELFQLHETIIRHMKLDEDLNSQNKR